MRRCSHRLQPRPIRGRWCPTVVGKHLTIRAVKSMLTRTGVDYSELSFERIDRSATHTGGTYEGQYVEKIDIKISGPKSLRQQAGSALFEQGLECATFPDCDYYSRGAKPF